MSADQPVSDEALSYGTCLQLIEATQRPVQPHRGSEAPLATADEPARAKVRVIVHDLSTLMRAKELG